MRARLIGPFLMVAFGVALLVGPARTSVIDAGTTSPCTTIPAQVGVVNDPCSTTTLPTSTTISCGLTEGVVIVDPCSTTTSTSTPAIDPCDEVSPAGVVSPCTTTSTVATTEAPTVPSTVDATTTTEDTGVAGTDDSASTTTTAAVTPATVNRGALARTGSNDLPLTGAAIALIALGTGLAVAERRHQVARNRA